MRPVAFELPDGLQERLERDRPSSERQLRMVEELDQLVQGGFMLAARGVMERLRQRGLAAPSALSQRG